MINRSKILLLLAVTAALLLAFSMNWAMDALAKVNQPAGGNLSTGFTYQGYLTLDETPADGDFDFIFEVFNADVDGESWGEIALDSVKVISGTFSVLLDFDPAVFNGEERWLEISVAKSTSPGEYTLFEERQRLSPVPYAHYALQAGEMDWYDIDNRPPGLDNGDDNTTYSAGFGLELDSTTFNVMTGTVQSLVSSGCDYGSAIRSINPDGSVECEPHDTRLGFNQISLDTPNDISGVTSIAIGVDGLPVISYFDFTNDDLKVAHCHDSSCTSASFNTIDSTGEVGSQSSIAIGTDGLPVISYKDETNDDLVVAHCNDIPCTSAITNTLDTTNNVGDVPSIAIGSDGLPIISYFSFTDRAFKVAHCNDITCTNAGIVVIHSYFGNPSHASIAIGTDGVPVIGYYVYEFGNINFALKAVHCNDVACTSFTTYILDHNSTGGSTTIGADGLPLILYSDWDDDDLQVAHCNDIACTTAITNTVDSGNVISFSSITIGSDGLPIISYKDATENVLKVAHCNDLLCTNVSIITVDDSINVGWGSSITVGVDGLPIISYVDNSNSDLKVTHCSNEFCIPFWRP